MDRPNIPYLHSHDSGRYVQPYGHPVPTPNLQRLAEEGVLFRHAFNAALTGVHHVVRDPLTCGYDRWLRAHTREAASIAQQVSLAGARPGRASCGGGGAVRPDL